MKKEKQTVTEADVGKMPEGAINPPKLIKARRSDAEAAFEKWCEEQGIKIEALIYRDYRPWVGAVYIFRFERDGEWSGPNFLQWKNDATFPEIIKAIGGTK